MNILNKFSLEGRIALVTAGSGRCLGAALAKVWPKPGQRSLLHPGRCRGMRSLQPRCGNKDTMLTDYSST